MSGVATQQQQAAWYYANLRAAQMQAAAQAQAAAAQTQPTQILPPFDTKAAMQGFDQYTAWNQQNPAQPMPNATTPLVPGFDPQAAVEQGKQGGGIGGLIKPLLIIGALGLAAFFGYKHFFGAAKEYRILNKVGQWTKQTVPEGTLFRGNVGKNGSAVVATQLSNGKYNLGMAVPHLEGETLAHKVTTFAENVAERSLPQSLRNLISGKPPEIPQVIQNRLAKRAPVVA